MKILVVEDEPLSAVLLEDSLVSMGYTVEVRSNGRDALEFLKQDEVCRLVITDWEMPEMNGLELIKELREALSSRYIYVILLTSREGTTNIIEGLSVGADDFLSKPFDPAELSVRLRSGERILSLETQNMTIFALAKLAESRDPETGAHLERVRKYSKLLAQGVAENDNCSYKDQITPQFIDLMYLTSPLHDIGKVAIPDYVLLKPGRLDEAEYEIMKYHTVEGAKTLDSVLKFQPDAKFLQMARDITACHHERYDGNGYPAMLKGEDIPLCARIFSIADVYDALISKRVYKEAFSHEVAKNIIVKGSGSQFDPQIVSTFIQVSAKFKEIITKIDSNPDAY